MTMRENADLSNCCDAPIKEAFYGKRICSECRTETADPPTRRDGEALSGVCDLCEEAIYNAGDHTEGCVYGR